ncbi:MAG: hypothetical protein JJ894_04330 [Dinoroseobacter sp.]|nr:hypothetical protein [Dinoroseobacter sp.]
MDQYVNLILNQYLLPFREQLQSLSAEGWAIVAAIFFGTVIMMRCLRMVRRADAAVATEYVTEESAKPALTPKRPKRVTRQSMREMPTNETYDDGHHHASQAPRPAPVGNAAQTRPAPEPAEKYQSPRATGKTSLTPGEIADALNSVHFDGVSLMKWQEYCLLRDIEGLLHRLGSGHRLFCHVALREFFEPSSDKHSAALRNAVENAIGPYRADFLIIDRHGYPAMGIGFGETDPVVRTVFVQAQLPCLTVEADYDWAELELELVDMLGVAPRQMRKTA